MALSRGIKMNRYQKPHKLAILRRKGVSRILISIQPAVPINLTSAKSHDLRPNRQLTTKQEDQLFLKDCILKAYTVLPFSFYYGRNNPFLHMYKDRPLKLD